MSETDRADVFPLPLVPFEQYMLLDDHAHRPMTGVLAMRFRGQFDRPALEAALDEARRRHPLFWALVDETRRGPCWIAAPAGHLPLDWSSVETPVDCPHDEAFDLRREPGFRMWIRQGADGAQLTFLLHHAVSDAIGGMQFLGDVLAGYALRRSPGAPSASLPAPVPQRLCDRGRFQQPAPKPVSAWSAIRFTMGEAIKWFARRPAPLAAPRFPEGAAEPYQFPGIYAHTFDEAQTQGLRDLAARHGATLNDLLLRDLFLTLRAWNDSGATAGGPRDRAAAWLRIAMPTNLREPDDQYLPSTNRMSYAFLTRRLAECDDAAALLAGLRRETAAIKQWRLGLTFLRGLAVLLRVPGAVPLVLTGQRCLATAVLSNVGDPGWHFWQAFPCQDGLLSMGDVRLQEFVAAPPLRALTRACFVAARYAGRLTLCVRCDRHTFRPPDARRLLALYAERLKQSLAEQ